MGAMHRRRYARIVLSHPKGWKTRISDLASGSDLNRIFKNKLDARRRERASNKKQIAMVKTSASLYGFTLVNLLGSKIFAIVH